MLEIIITVVALLLDQLVKYWSVTVLSQVGQITVIDGVFHLLYAENTGEDVSFIRGRSVVMTIIRVLQLALVLYILIKHRKKIKPITRIALSLFLAGLIGNQINYFLFDFVPDMFYMPFIGNIVFNLADIWALFAMIVLFIRLAFFEGRDFVEWVDKRFFGGGKKKEKATAPSANALIEEMHREAEETEQEDHE